MLEINFILRYTLTESSCDVLISIRKSAMDITVIISCALVCSLLSQAEPILSLTAKYKRYKLVLRRHWNEQEL